jgi:prephenate dehydratase
MHTPTVNQSEALASAATLPKKIAIQGVAGAFHDIAARHFFSQHPVDILPAYTFEELVQLIEKRTADTGLMAIENTLAGSIMGNYHLLLRSSLQVTGEVYLRIQQNLMALPGQKIENLKEVYSHPMAIAQCETWFRQHPHIRLIEADDTALSARMIREKEMSGAGAIASELAASMYGLDILAPGIETNKQNYTRFLVLDRQENATPPSSADKVSLCFTLSHEVGSLHRVLSILAAYDLNLTKIQSSPIAGSPWEYFFFVDFICAGRIDWQQAVEALRPLTANVKVLGAYPQGNRQF